MSWSHEFLDLLGASPVRLAWAIEVAPLGTGVTIGVPGIIAASYPAQGVATLLETPSIRGVSVGLQTWRYSPASAEVRVQLADSQGLASSLRRGSYVRILAGSESWDVGRFQPVFLGVLAGMTCSDGVTLVLEIWDVLTALTSTSTMFGAAGATTTQVTAIYLPGIDTTIDVADASVFEMETGGSGVIKIDPYPLPPFYLTYTGKVGNQLTGLSAVGVFGTTAISSTVGAVITNVVHLSGHPITITRKLLQSTGLGTNGTGDVYPASWGFGLPGEDVDYQDMTGWFDVVKTSVGSHLWTVLLEAPVESPYDWWAGLLSQAGIWIANNQGSIVVRAAQSTRPGEILKYSYVTLTDTNMMGPPVVEWYDSRVSGRSYSMVVATAGSSLTSLGSSLTAYWPMMPAISYDLSSVVIANEAAVQSEVSARLKYWALTSPEGVTVDMVGCIWASLCPGDIVQIQSNNASGRLQSTYDGYDQRDAMVVDSEADWTAGTSRLRLSVLPDSTSDEWV